MPAVYHLPGPVAVPALASPLPSREAERVQTPEMAQLHQVAQKARDLGAAIVFYRDVLGLRFIARFDPPGLAFFDIGGARLMLEATAPPATLYFRVAELDAFYRHLRDQGVHLEQEPQLVHCDEDGVFGGMGEEEWMAFCRDPDGNLIGLASRRRPAAAANDQLSSPTISE